MESIFQAYFIALGTIMFVMATSLLIFYLHSFEKTYQTMYQNYYDILQFEYVTK